MSRLRVVAWEMTRACPLHCRHCRAESVLTCPADELSTAEGKAFLDDLAGMGKPLLILTGGEPMERPDMLELARYGTDLGMRVVAAPCGKYLTVDAARNLLAAGIGHVSLSIDGADAATHNKLRGLDGAFAMVMKACQCAREAGLPFQVNTTVHAGNVGQLEELGERVLAVGASAWDLFLLVPTGRGRAMEEVALTAPAYEEVLLWAREKTLRFPRPIKLTCAPHYVRVAAEAGIRGTPCLGGKGFVFVGHRGQVQICGFLDVAAGNIRTTPLSVLWQESPLFKEVRNPSKYRGKCGSCEYRARCGGCRARAYADCGDYMGPEPYCVYQPGSAPLLPEPDGPRRGHG